MSSIIEGALSWAEYNIPVFPCGANKAPLTSNGFYDAETDPAKVKALFEFYGESTKLIGARMGKDSGLFVMDFDLYKGGEPKQYMEDLIAKGALPDSRVHRTMHGGLHVFYRSETEWPNLKPCNGVEVKGEGGYVIVPPSPGYEVIDARQVVLAPVSLLEQLHVARDAASNATIDDLKFSIMDGSDFHDALRGIAAKMSARGVDPVDIMLELKKILQASDASDPEHPRHSRWRSLMRGQSQELTRIVRSGYTKYNSHAQDERAREAIHGKEDVAAKAGFSASPTEGTEEAKEYTDEEWPFTDGYFADEEHDLAEQAFTMYPIFAENESVVLFAEPKTGKTALALTTALHIACGFDLGQFKVAEAGPTLYYALEGSRAIRLRVAAWKKKKKEEGVELPERIPMFVIEGHASFLKEERRKDEANKIIAANSYSIKRGAGPLKAVYLDTLTKAMSGGDQNSVEDTSHLFELIGLLREGGVTATVIFVHHKSRQGTARGSTNIEAEPDVLLDVGKKDDLVTMRVARARSIEDGNEFYFRISGVDLGVTTQGHPLAGVYVAPDSDVTDAANEIGLSLEQARRLNIIISMGEGEHHARAVIRALKAAGLGPTNQSGTAYSDNKYKTTRCQKFLYELVTNTGRLFKGHAIELVRESDESIAGIMVRPL